MNQSNKHTVKNEWMADHWQFLAAAKPPNHSTYPISILPGQISYIA
jgi:hypothetical protein